MELTLFLDHACNLRCDYCYGGHKFTRRMPSAVMKQAVDLALAERPSLFEVSFFGGEPLLHPDLIEETLAYVESASARQGLGPGQVRFIMNSNGTLISERALAILAPPRRWTTFVSLDGPAAVATAGLFLCLSGCSSYSSQTNASGGSSGARGGSAGSVSSAGGSGSDHSSSGGYSSPSGTTVNPYQGGSSGHSGASGGQGGNGSGHSPSVPDAGSDSAMTTTDAGADQDDGSSGEVPPPDPDAR